MSEETKYPRQVYAAQNTKVSFSVDAFLVKVVGAEGEPPLEIYRKGLSRLSLNIFENKAGGHHVHANLRISDLAGVWETGHAAFQAETLMSALPMNQIMAALSPTQQKTSGGHEKEITNAKTILTMGTYKGRSPYDILASDPGQVDGLVRQREFLMKNADKYPRNKAQADAISAALTLFESGQMNQAEGETAAQTHRTTVLFAPLPHPLVRKEADGLCPTYELEIDWVHGNEYPVEIRIRNYKAPVVRRESGAVNVQTSGRKERSRRIWQDLKC